MKQAQAFARTSNFCKIRRRQVRVIALEDPDLAQMISDHKGFGYDFSSVPRSTKRPTQEILDRWAIKCPVIYLDDEYTIKGDN